jgi:biopolymer transport protein ExbD
MFERKERKKNPDIPTASLSDIMVILLFFFIIAAQHSDTPELVLATTPTEERFKENKEDNRFFIRIGKKSGDNSNEVALQFMDKIIDVDQLGNEINAFRLKKNLSEKSNATLTAVLTCDVNVKTGFVRSVEKELREAGVYKVINIVK